MLLQVVETNWVLRICLQRFYAKTPKKSFIGVSVQNQGLKIKLNFKAIYIVFSIQYT